MYHWRQSKVLIKDKNQEEEGTGTFLCLEEIHIRREVFLNTMDMNGRIYRTYFAFLCPSHVFKEWQFCLNNPSAQLLWLLLWMFWNCRGSQAKGEAIFSSKNSRRYFLVGNEHLSTLTELDYNRLALSTMSEQIFLLRISRGKETWIAVFKLWCYHGVCRIYLLSQPFLHTTVRYNGYCLNKQEARGFFSLQRDICSKRFMRSRTLAGRWTELCRDTGEITLFYHVNNCVALSKDTHTCVYLCNLYFKSKHTVMYIHASEFFLLVRWREMSRT